MTQQIINLAVDLVLSKAIQNQIRDYNSIILKFKGNFTPGPLVGASMMFLLEFLPVFVLLIRRLYYLRGAAESQAPEAARKSRP